MDRKSIERFKKSLQVRHRELQSGVAKTQHIAQHDHGKDEGDRANTSLSREIDLAQKSSGYRIETDQRGHIRQLSQLWAGD